MPADTPGGRGVSADEHLQAGHTGQGHSCTTLQIFSFSVGITPDLFLHSTMIRGGATVTPSLVPRQAGRGLQVGEALADGSARLLRCAGGVPFDHPEFAPGIGRYIRLSL
jgi:hypothetical protein